MSLLYQFQCQIRPLILQILNSNLNDGRGPLGFDLVSVVQGFYHIKMLYEFSLGFI